MTDVERIPTSASKPRHDNRRAIVSLGAQEVEQLLKLPEGYRIIHVEGTWDPPSIRIVVESADLPPQPHNTYLPVLEGQSSRLKIVVDGVAWTRWEWQPA